MKTRLLKRLRKKAKKHSIIVFFPDRVEPYSVLQTDGEYYYSEERFMSLDDATKWAVFVRRNYVTSEARAIRKKRMKPIILDM